MQGPPERLREALAASRRYGHPFPQAWPVALTEALSGAADADELADWSEALRSTAGAWEAAYGRERASRAELALHAVAVDGDREPIAEAPAGHCQRCGEPIPARARGRRARYCGGGCRRRASEERLAA